MYFNELIRNVDSIIQTKHFKRDAHEFDTGLITHAEEATHLHKFEETIEHWHIFRALIHKTHYVYAINDNNLIFLRAFHNFNEYKKFLEDKKSILHMISHEL